MTPLEAMIKLRDKGPVSLDDGVCGNIDKFLRRDQYCVWLLFFGKVIKNWPDHKQKNNPAFKSILFPIENFELHSNNKTLWQGAQLAKRISLLNYLIDCWNKEHQS